ncbi:hypothetical protein Tco_0760617 [Tanacetum coccineum]
MKHSYSNDDTCFSIDVIDEILEEDFDALLNEGSKILYSIKGTLLKEEIFSEFDEFMAMTADKSFESESDTRELPFEKITINTDYKIKTSLEEPPTNLEIKPLPDNLEYVLLEEPSFLLKMADIPGICPSFCKHKIQLLDDKKLVVQKQRRLNPNMQEVVRKEIMKLLDTGIIYVVANSPWFSLIHCIPKKGGITVVTNKNDELVPTRTVMGWRCEFNRLHNEDLDSTPKDVRFDAESYLLESLVNRDTLMASPPKIDFLLDEFAGELTRLKSIPSGIDNINLDPEGDILFLESLLYDNSSPRPPEAFQANSNTIIESLPISIDALREEIDIFPGLDDSIPSGIESDDFDSEDDDNSTSLPEFESFHVDYPDSGDSTIDVVEDIPVDVPNILPTHPAL